MCLYYNYRKQPKNKYDRVEYSCSHCEYVATQGITLNKHIESKHEGVRFPCPQFEYAATVANAQCDYAATQTSHLKKNMLKVNTKEWNILNHSVSMLQLKQVIWTDHVENKHEDVRYPCSQCDYAATRASHLMRHVERNIWRKYSRTECE